MKHEDQYYRNERSEMAAFLPPAVSRSLEFGCSQGLFSKRIKEKYGAECWGVDLDTASIAMAATHLDQALCGDATAVLTTLPRAYFDLLVCNDFLEHLPDPGAFLREAAAVMTPGATLVASVPNVRSWSNILELLVYKEWKYKDSGILDRTHLRFFTLKSFRRFLEENGLHIEILEGTRPSSSKVFMMTNLLTLGFIGDMKFSGLAARAKFGNEL